MGSIHEQLDDEARWQLIHAEYVSGKLSIAAIGRLYQVSADAIRKRASRANPPWERQLLPTLECEVRARLVAEAEFQPKTEEERIKLLAERQKAVIIGNRNDILKVRAAANTLLDRLNAMLSNEDIEGPFIGEKESPADLLKKVSESLRHLIPLERQAFGIVELPVDTSQKANTGVVFLPGKDDGTAQGGNTTTGGD